MRPCSVTRGVWSPLFKGKEQDQFCYGPSDPLLGSPLHRTAKSTSAGIHHYSSERWTSSPVNCVADFFSVLIEYPVRYAGWSLPYLAARVPMYAWCNVLHRPLSPNLQAAEGGGGKPPWLGTSGGDREKRRESTEGVYQWRPLLPYSPSTL